MREEKKEDRERGGNKVYSKMHYKDTQKQTQKCKEHTGSMVDVQSK